MTPLQTTLEALAVELRARFEDLLRETDLGPKPWLLPMPRICVMEAKRSTATKGWHSPDRWHQGAITLDEIVLTPDAVSHGVFRAIEVLAHEFVHVANAAVDRADTCRDGRYHNKKFKETATVMGLVVSQCSPHGWHETTLGPELKGWVQQLIRDKKVSPHVFKYQRVGSSSKTRSLVKVACDCGTFAYVTQSRVDDFAILCGACGLVLLPSEDERP